METTSISNLTMGLLRVRIRKMVFGALVMHARPCNVQVAVVSLQLGEKSFPRRKHEKQDTSPYANTHGGELPVGSRSNRRHESVPGAVRQRKLSVVHATSETDLDDCATIPFETGVPPDT